MKTAFPYATLFVLLLFLQSCKEIPEKETLKQQHNAIDSIQTKQDVYKLLMQIDPDHYKHYTISDTLKFENKICQQTTDSLHLKPWVKADFDQNGLTDILITLDSYTPYIICLLDQGNRKYQTSVINLNLFPSCVLADVKFNDHHIPVIQYYYKPFYFGHKNKADQLAYKTLIYRFGDFIEENDKPSHHTIEKIEFDSGPCFGSFPIYKLSIHADKSAIWTAEEYNKINNKEIKGTYKTILTDEKYKELVLLLNYIDFEKLKDTYSVSWSDDKTYDLKITYANGKTKTISDYGGIGTYGLKKAYKLLSELRENQKWEK